MTDEKNKWIKENEIKRICVSEQHSMQIKIESQTACAYIIKLFISQPGIFIISKYT